MPKTVTKNKISTAKKVTKKSKIAKKPKKRVSKKAKALGLKKEEKVVKTEEKLKELPKKEILAKKPAIPFRKFIYKIGRRKEATAQVRLFSGKGGIVVNNKDFKKYFPTFELQQIVESPFLLVGQRDKCDAQIKTSGGGIKGQAEAVRLGIARCLKQRNIMFRVPLKKAGFLTRDPREKERKKSGLKRARRAPQWQKR